MKITYKCEICGESFTWANRLSIHIKQVHNETCKSYYDKFLKTGQKKDIVLVVVNQQNF